MQHCVVLCNSFDEMKHDFGVRSCVLVNYIIETEHTERKEKMLLIELDGNLIQVSEKRS